MTRVLVVDDDPSIREVVALYLQREGYDVSLARDGEEALRLERNDRPDLIVLDLMLPKMSGLEVCRQLQSARRPPIIMLTARSEEEDRVIGLGLGADDYVVKPFSPRELVARVAAVLRRVNQAADQARPDGQVIQHGRLRIDPARRDVQVEGRAISLTAREFDLLHFLATHADRVFTREQLLDAVWGYTFVADQSTVTVHVRRLREKIEADPAHPRYLVTVWGVGYRFESE